MFLFQDCNVFYFVSFYTDIYPIYFSVALYYNPSTVESVSRCQRLTGLRISALRALLLSLVLVFVVSNKD